MVDCTGCREIVSADLDGEATVEERLIADDHLDACPTCRGWTTRAAVVTRRVRVRPAEAAPDLIDGVLDLVHPSACGCPIGCRCGCQQGRACPCMHRPA
jgi:hypothetical protein